jgi:GxxExxY protein
MHKGISVGVYCADILVENSIILELKCVETLKPERHAQRLNYLKASGHQPGLLLNFHHRKLEYKRLINTPTRETP